MTTCAVCQLSDGLVINLIIAEPTDLPPNECQLIITPDLQKNNANIGDVWNGTVFVSGVTNGN